MYQSSLLRKLILLLLSWELISLSCFSAEHASINKENIIYGKIQQVSILLQQNKIQQAKETTFQLYQQALINDDNLAIGSALALLGHLNYLSDPLFQAIESMGNDTFQKLSELKYSQQPSLYKVLGISNALDFPDESFASVKYFVEAYHYLNAMPDDLHDYLNLMMGKIYLRNYLYTPYCLKLEKQHLPAESSPQNGCYSAKFTAISFFRKISADSKYYHNALFMLQLIAYHHQNVLYAEYQKLQTNTISFFTQDPGYIKLHFGKEQQIPYLQKSWEEFIIAHEQFLKLVHY